MLSYSFQASKRLRIVQRTVRKKKKKKKKKKCSDVTNDHHVNYILCKIYLAVFYVLQLFSSPKRDIEQIQIVKKKTILQT